MSEEIFNQIKSFVEDVRYTYDFPLERSTRIESELRIYGDDAPEFIIDFGKKFNVDVSHFMAADYFRGEGSDIFGEVIRLFTGKKEPRRKILTLGDLEKAVFAGKLDETVIADT